MYTNTECFWCQHPLCGAETGGLTGRQAHARTHTHTHTHTSLLKDCYCEYFTNFSKTAYYYYYCIAAFMNVFESCYFINAVSLHPHFLSDLTELTNHTIKLHTQMCNRLNITKQNRTHLTNTDVVYCLNFRR